jgi:Flp pilus assembly protein protease CpaA
MSSLLILFVVLATASISDMRRRTIPNYLTYGGLVWVFAVALHGDFRDNPYRDVESVVSDESFGRLNSETDFTSPGTLQAISTSNPNSLPEQSAFENEIAETFKQTTASAFTGCLALATPLLLLFAFDRVGGGDVKLGACIGAFTGFEAGLSILFFGHMMAGAFALLYMFRNRQSTADSRGIPMAVFYSMGTLLVVAGVSL